MCHSESWLPLGIKHLCMLLFSLLCGALPCSKSVPGWPITEQICLLEAKLYDLAWLRHVCMCSTPGHDKMQLSFYCSWVEIDMVYFTPKWSGHSSSLSQPLRGKTQSNVDHEIFHDEILVSIMSWHHGLNSLLNISLIRHASVWGPVYWESGHNRCWDMEANDGKLWQKFL